jgi:hypothetical protein
MRIAPVGLAAVFGAGIAAAAPPSIRPGIGIADIRLGMTEAAVRRSLGPPPAHVRQSAGFGRVRAVFQYEGTAFTVVLDGRRSDLRVTAIATTRRSDRTRDGLGVGTRETALARRYGGALHCDPLETVASAEGPFIAASQGWRRCVVAGPRATRTHWFTNVPDDLSRHFPFVRTREWRPNARVVEVVVRTAGSSATHFGL